MPALMTLVVEAPYNNNSIQSVDLASKTLGLASGSSGLGLGLENAVHEHNPGLVTYLCCMMSKAERNSGVLPRTMLAQIAANPSFAGHSCCLYVVIVLVPAE